jgi:hypothetical protein
VFVFIRSLRTCEEQTSPASRLIAKPAPSYKSPAIPAFESEQKDFEGISLTSASTPRIEYPVVSSRLSIHFRRPRKLGNMPFKDEEWAEIEEELPGANDDVLEKYRHGRDGLIAEENKRRSGMVPRYQSMGAERHC